jgi:2,4'-dihydroxyacetophenone dioxygenase
MFDRTQLITSNPSQLPWVRWGMEGAHFKLLNADPATGSFALFIKMDAGITAPRHRHVGAVEGMVLEGGFYYLEDPATRFEHGAYLYEPAGAIHQPTSPQGALMFGVFHGALEGLDENGNVLGYLDCAWHIATWQKTVHHP